MKIILAFAFVLVCLPRFVLAQESPTAAEIKEWREHPQPWSQTPCKELIWRLDLSATSDFNFIYGAYLQGLIDGMISMAATTEIYDAKRAKWIDFGSSPALMLAHAREYCQKHQTETLKAAGFMFYVKVIGID